MPALAPLVLGVGGLFGLLSLFGGGSSDASPAPTPAPAPLPAMTCDTALAALPADIKAAVAKVLVAPSLTSEQAKSALLLALSLEMAASAPGLTPASRQALLVSAKCVRDAAMSKVSVDPTPLPTPPKVPDATPSIPKPLPGGGGGGGLPVALAAPALYGDANGVDWLVTNPSAGTWLAMLDGPPPSSIYASGLPFMRSTRDQVVQAIEERAAMAASAGSGGA